MIPVNDNFKTEIVQISPEFKCWTAKVGTNNEFSKYIGHGMSKSEAITNLLEIINFVSSQ